MKNSKWTYVLLGAWIGMFLVGKNIPGSIEGHLRPVVSEFKITETNVVLNGTEFYGTFYKGRECSFVDLTGQIQKNNITTDIDVVFLDKERVRTQGAQEFGPWFVKLDQLELNSMKLIATHDCHIAYNTVTRLQ